MRREHDKYDLTANIQEVLNVIHTPSDAGERSIPDEEALETIHVYPVEGGGILLTRTPIEEDEDLDTTSLPTQPVNQPISNDETGVVFFGLFVILTCLMCIMVQCYLIVNPFTVTVTLAAKEQQLTLQGTMQLGRVLNLIAVSQSATVPTTGHGHQDAKAATGELTFYNGSFTAQTIDTGTVFSGADGVQVATDQAVTIPAATPGNPPQFGQAFVSAHATNMGASGNIQAGDISSTTSTLQVRNNQFTGGQDERNYQSVAKRDIDNTAASLKATLTQSVPGALQGQLKPNEALVTPSCMTTTTSDHQRGEEATQVKVTVSETCSAVAYDQDALQAKVTDLLNRQAEKKLGSGYSLLESPQITIAGATTARQVRLAFTSVSTWVYALSSAQQHHIKTIIAAKNTQKALRLLLALPGIESASLQWSGFGDATRIPKNLNTIHLMIFYGL